MNYNHLRYFWAVAHDGNLTRTAQRMNLSQSALSVQIKKLEDRLGVALFERRGRQLVLTEAGRITLDHADTIFETGKDLLSTLRRRGRARELLRVGALATLSRNFQLEFLRPVIGNSEIEIVLRSGTSTELLGALETLNLDVVLTDIAPQQDPRSPFKVQPLSDQAVSLIGVPSLAPQDASLTDLLTSAPLIVPTHDSAIRLGLDRICSRYDIIPTIAAEVDDMAMMRLLAREGIGLAVLPPIAVQDELHSGSLVDVGHDLGLREGFYAITIQRRQVSATLNSLLDRQL